MWELQQGRIWRKDFEAKSQGIRRNNKPKFPQKNLYLKGRKVLLGDFKIAAFLQNPQVREKLGNEMVFAYSDSFEQFEIRLSHNTMQRKTKER